MRSRNDSLESERSRSHAHSLAVTDTNAALCVGFLLLRRGNNAHFLGFRGGYLPEVLLPRGVWHVLGEQQTVGAWLNLVQRSAGDWPWGEHFRRRVHRRPAGPVLPFLFRQAYQRRGCGRDPSQLSHRIGQSLKISWWTLQKIKNKNLQVTWNCAW